MVSVPCAKLCILDTEAPGYTEQDPDCNTATLIFHTAAAGEGMLDC